MCAYRWIWSVDQVWKLIVFDSVTSYRTENQDLNGNSNILKYLEMLLIYLSIQLTWTTRCYLSGWVSTWCLLRHLVHACSVSLLAGPHERWQCDGTTPGQAASTICLSLSCQDYEVTGLTGGHCLPVIRPCLVNNTNSSFNKNIQRFAFFDPNNYLMTIRTFL